MMMPFRAQQEQYYPYPLSTSTVNANVQCQSTSPINTFNSPEVQWSPIQEITLTDWNQSEGYSDFNHFDNYFVSSEETDSPFSSGSGMTGNIEGDGGFVELDDIDLDQSQRFDLDQNQLEAFQSQQITGRQTSNTSKENFDHPLWSELFDSWIPCMGHLLTPGPTATGVKPNADTLSWNTNIRAGSTVQKKQKQWDHQCLYCGVSIDGGILRFEEHVRKMHQLKCICGEEFSSTDALGEHIRLDNEAAAYIQKSNSTNSLPKHAFALVRSRNKKAPFECDFCERFFTNRSAAIKHRKLEHLSGVEAQVRNFKSSLGTNTAPSSHRARKTKPQETIVRVPEYLALADDTKPKASGLPEASLNPTLPFIPTPTKAVKEVAAPVQKFVVSVKVASSTAGLIPLEENHSGVSILKRFSCLVCHQEYTTKKYCRSHLKTKHPDMEPEDYIEDRMPIKTKVLPVSGVQNGKRAETWVTPTATFETTSPTTTGSLIDNGNSIRRPVKRKLNCGGEIIELKLKGPCSGSLPAEIILYNKTKDLGFETELTEPPLQVHHQPALPPYSSWAPAPKRNRRKTAHQEFLRELTESLRSIPGGVSSVHFPNPFENGADVKNI